MTVTYDETKFTEMLLYAARLLEDDPSGGATKLNKLLYFADFAHMRRAGAPITGADYQKLVPGAQHLAHVVAQLTLGHVGHDGV